jgi:hypothetical protein
MFLHGQAPFPIALGRVEANMFEIVSQQIRLVDLSINLPAADRKKENDGRGFALLAAYILPEASPLLVPFCNGPAPNLLEIRNAIADKPHGTAGKSCECGAALSELARFCSVCGNLIAKGPAGKQKLELEIDLEPEVSLLAAWNERRVAPRRWQQLAETIDNTGTAPGFDRLLCIDRLPRLTRMFYQEEAALRVLRLMRGRALLADEVGLGKTIEAGLIVKELLVRGMLSSILVVCPGPLVTQWQAEFFEKFDELLLVLGRDVDSTLAWRCGRLIASYDSIEEHWHAEELLKQSFDLVILDEAHYLNDPENFRALETVRSIRKRYFLLLSATPMHNDLGEFHNILTLLRPGHVGTREDFLAEYADPESKDGARNADTLRRIVQEVMIRNLRTNVAKDHRFPQRKASRRELKSSPEGLEAYFALQSFLRAKAAEGPLRRLLLDRGGLGERLVSSRAALTEHVGRLATTLMRRGGEELLRVCFTTCSRVTKLSQHEADGGKFQEREGIAVEIFPILGETATTIEPCDGSFNDPALG